MNQNERKGHLLIVDDTVENLKVLGIILRDNGYRITAVTSGAQALQSLENALPDLILLDVMMPEMDGYAVCQKLKASSSTKEIPIIFLTAKVDTEDIVKGFELGAVDYVTKPFNATELLVRVNSHLQLKFSQEKILRQQNELNELIHILCHDLSNPLGGIMAILESEDWFPNYLDENKKTFLSLARRQSEIIKFVRELRAMVEGKMNLNLSAVNLNEALRESLETLEYQFLQKNIQPVLNIEGEINIIAEKISLVNSVLNNLLTNAVKFSYPDSKVVIEARHEGEQVVITIKDSGIGIPQNILEDLFTVSSTTTRCGTNGEKGTGFGMPLVKEFVTAYGGLIEISSKEESEFSNECGTEIKLFLKSS